MSTQQETTSGRNGKSSDAGKGIGAAWDSTQVREVIRSAGERLEDQIHAHPYRTMALVFGCGYVLGGGMPRMFTRLAGGTLSALVLDAVVAEVAQRLLAASGWGTDDDEAAESKRSSGRMGGGASARQDVGREP